MQTGVVAKQKARGLRVMAPTVSRHFDFLESLVGEGKLPIDHTLLRTIAPVLTFIIGSAPVGPTTITRFQVSDGRSCCTCLDATPRCCAARPLEQILTGHTYESD